MPTLQELDALADQVPIINQKAARQAQAGASYNLQQQVGGAAPTPGTNVNKVAQSVAPQAVQAQAAPVLAAAQQTQQQLGQVAQVGLAQQATTAQTSLANQERSQREELVSRENTQKLEQARADITSRKRVTGAEQASAKRLQALGIEVDNKVQLATLRQREQLSRLGGDVRDKILDSRLRFDRDEMGRKFTNERQLADYVLANAKTEQDFRDKLREMQQVHQRKIQMLEISERKIREAVQRGFISEQQQLDNEQRAKLSQLAAKMREKIQKEKADARNKNSMITGAFTIGGAIVGGVLGAGAGGVGAAPGAMIGASAGAAAGGLVSGALASNEGGGDDDL